jgi:hypothetical protein
LAFVLVYIMIAGYAVLALRIFVQVLFRTAIENRKRRPRTEKNAAHTHTFRELVGKRGWANTWLPRNAEITVSVPNGKVTGNLAGAAPVVKQAIAIVSFIVVFGLAWTAAAQEPTAREFSASTLKQELIDIESKETRLRMRLEELDEQLKPECIDGALAGIGSTHPEELREHRRKLLTIERNGLQAQLDLLEEDRARIEAAITARETEEYLRYTQPSPTPPAATAPAAPTTEISVRKLRFANFPLQKLFVAVAMLPLTCGLILLLIVATQKFRRWTASRDAAATSSVQPGGKASFDKSTQTSVLRSRELRVCSDDHNISTNAS